MILELVLVFAIGIVLTAELFIIILPSRSLQKNQDSRPFVSVLLAVRNEEAAIDHCMSSLLKQDYGLENFEIIIGDDASTDSTLEIARKYESEYSSVHVVKVTEQLSKSIGKANVLSQIAEDASGELLLITDADTRPNRSWVAGVVSTMQGSEADLLVGVTKVSEKSFFDKLQDIEWVMILSILKKVSDLGIPITGLGSNMAVRREAYELTGGYKDLSGSITEDFALVERFRNQRLRIRNSFEPKVLAVTDGVQTLGKLLNQRKRWMRGAFMQPFFQSAFLVLFSLLPLPLVFLCFLNCELGLLLFCVQLILVQIVIIQAKTRIGERYSLWNGLLFEVFRQLFWLVSLAYYVLPAKIEWKGRHYK